MVEILQEFITDNGIHRNRLRLSNACFSHQQPHPCFYFHTRHHFQVFPFYSPLFLRIYSNTPPVLSLLGENDFEHLGLVSHAVDLKCYFQVTCTLQICLDIFFIYFFPFLAGSCFSWELYIWATIPLVTPNVGRADKNMTQRYTYLESYSSCIFWFTPNESSHLLWISI